MAYFELSFQNPAGQNVKALVDFPDDCYLADGGEIGIPTGQRVPAGNYGYIVYYKHKAGHNCNVGSTTREWTLPYTPNTSGQGLTVFLVDRASGEVKDKKDNTEPVEEDL